MSESPFVTRGDWLQDYPPPLRIFENAYFIGSNTEKEGDPRSKFLDTAGRVAA